MALFLPLMTRGAVGRIALPVTIDYYTLNRIASTFVIANNASHSDPATPGR
jgi:hypothetical protein